MCQGVLLLLMCVWGSGWLGAVPDQPNACSASGSCAFMYGLHDAAAGGGRAMMVVAQPPFGSAWRTHLCMSKVHMQVSYRPQQCACTA